MDRNFISLQDAADGLAGNNDADVAMWLALLANDATTGNLQCIKSWTDHQSGLPGGVSFERAPGEWRVLRTALKTWMELHTIRQAFGYKAPSATVTPAPAIQAAPAQTPPPVLAASDGPARTKRQTWRDVAWPYVVDVFNSGRYATAKEFYKVLEKKAGADSPFECGEGNNRGNLFVREISKTVALKTVQNAWAELKASRQTA